MLTFYCIANSSTKTVFQLVQGSQAQIVNELSHATVCGSDAHLMSF